MLFILFFNKKSGIKTLLNIVVNINCLILLKHGFKERNLIDQHYLQWFHSNIVMLMVYEVCIASRNSLCSVFKQRNADFTVWWTVYGGENRTISAARAKCSPNVSHSERLWGVKYLHEVKHIILQIFNSSLLWLMLF